jgi:hypothetical protein
MAAVLDGQAGDHAEQGFERGRLLRLITSGTDLPQLVAQREYVDTASYERMQSELAPGAALSSKYADVAKLAHKVERSAWRVERAE